MNKEKHLIVVSVDALVFEDLEYARNLPNFSRIMNAGSRIEKIRTIYPSVTHPVHATMLTGCAAGKTGVVNNIKFDPYAKDGVWYNDMSDVKVENIFRAAKRAGLTTASCVFPLTVGGDEWIDYHVPGCMSLAMRGHEHEPLEAYKALGLTPCLEYIVAEALEKCGGGLGHPETDEFTTYAAANIIRRYKPNLLLTHPGWVDSARHRSGVFSELVLQSLRDTDRWIGMLWDAVCDAGIEDSTDIVIMGDHGQMNITRRINFNVFLADAGLIDVNEDGTLKDWRAFAASTGLCSYVYLKDKSDKALYDRVYTLLKHFADEGIYGIEQVFTTEQVKEKYGLYGDFSFVLETDGYTAFAEGITRPIIVPVDNSDYRKGAASHGYLPEKGPQPTFLVAGPSFKQGVVIPEGSVLNHAPTIAAALGFELPEADGKPVTELLK